MMNLNQIAELVRINQKPFLHLKIKDGLNIRNAGKYSCEDCNTGDKTEARIEKALNWLSKYVEMFPAGTVFYITMKSSENANQGGVVGDFEFSAKGKAGGSENENISGLGNVPAGYVHESEVKAKLLEQSLMFEREKFANQIEGLKEDFKERIDLAIQTKQEYTPETLKGLADSIAVLFGKTPATNENLAGTDNEPTLKELAAQKLAAEFASKYTLEQIQAFSDKLANPLKEQKGNE
jgi:hypothetical protein